MSSGKMLIRGAREHNLQSIDLDIPRDRLIVITGVSGSGKSSLAFDTIYAEGQRRDVGSLSTKPPRSPGATVTDTYDYLPLLFARIGKPHCYSCGKPIASQTVQQIVDQA